MSALVSHTACRPRFRNRPRWSDAAQSRTNRLHLSDATLKFKLKSTIRPSEWDMENMTTRKKTKRSGFLRVFREFRLPNSQIKNPPRMAQITRIN